ncbi:endonuclease/exonuclease/phosphatase family protein [Haloferula chungangensis]|uniref:Endonuclease/exonuclease/phosphatase family protein n=1 Tax=Haloferula chungangensis TaxID=1048331 RepID=A0ABW2L792_9BACT
MTSEILEKPESKPGWKSRFKCLVRFGLIAVFCSFLLSLTIGDYFTLTAVFVYATPWLIRLMVAIAAFAILRKQLWWMSATLLISGLHGGHQSYRRGAAIKHHSAGSFTIATWNAGRELDDRPSEWHFESDVVAIIESGHFDKPQWRKFQKSTPDYHWLQFESGTMLGVRGKHAKFESLGEHDLFRCFRVKVTIDHFDPFTVVVVDMRSQPWLSREEPMRRIFAATKPGEPTIILGDFNTPPDSRWIRKASFKRWSLANRRHEQGFVETWPFGLPLHCLDQIWVSEEFKVLDCKQESRPSDHRLVKARLLPSS